MTKVTIQSELSAIKSVLLLLVSDLDKKKTVSREDIANTLKQMAKDESAEEDEAHSFQLLAKMIEELN